MNKDKLKNLLLNEPSKEDIYKLIQVEEKAGDYVKYLVSDDGNTENENLITVDFSTDPITIYAFQDGEEIISLEIKDGICQNWRELAEETYKNLESPVIGD